MCIHVAAYDNHRRGCFRLPYRSANRFVRRNSAAFCRHPARLTCTPSTMCWCGSRSANWRRTASTCRRWWITATICRVADCFCFTRVYSDVYESPLCTNRLPNWDGRMCASSWSAVSEILRNPRKRITTRLCSRWACSPASISRFPVTIAPCSDSKQPGTAPCTIRLCSIESHLTESKSSWPFPRISRYVSEIYLNRFFFRSIF